MGGAFKARVCCPFSHENRALYIANQYNYSPMDLKKVIFMGNRHSAVPRSKLARISAVYLSKYLAIWGEPRLAQNRLRENNNAPSC